MNITFDNNTKIALLNLLNGQENKIIRLKVLAFGCGKPALGLIADGVRDDDLVKVIDDITFAIQEKEQLYLEDVEILFNEKSYTGGFYVHYLNK
jgi:Uncharacterized conserved protein